MKYGFVIDNRKCIGCHACTVACKTENQVPVGVNRTWVKYVEKGVFPNTRRVFQVTLQPLREASLRHHLSRDCDVSAQRWDCRF